MKRPRQQIDDEVFKKAVDDMAAAGGLDISLCVTIGEPLLDTKLIERVRYVNQYPQYRGKIGFYTTLQWLHKFDLDEFFDSGIAWLRISTSLSGPRAYQKFFGVNLYAKMFGNLVALLRENNRRGEPIRISLMLKPTEEDYSQIANHPDFIAVQELISQDLSEELKYLKDPVDTWNGSVQLPTYLKPAKLKKKRVPCKFLYEGLTVYSNGAIGACFCRDIEANSELVVGSVGETGLLEAWHGKVQKIRDDWAFRKKIPELCKTCVHYGSPKRKIFYKDRALEFSKALSSLYGKVLGLSRVGR